MKLGGIDLVIIIGYFVLINVIGISFSKAKNVKDYFLGAKSIPWQLACFSIVATETSTLTFISIPGLAYISGLGFLQVALGYILGRILVAVVLLPKYFAGDFDTVYQFIHNRFGISSRRIIAVIFHITRLLGDSIRLFVTAIPLKLLTGMDYTTSVVVIGLATFVYTLYGGIKSVVIVDSIQLGLYIVSAIAGICMVVYIMDESFLSIFAKIPGERLTVVSSGLEQGWRSLLGSYNIFSGLIGGALLSFASHGTDHLMVQRLLTCRDERSAKKAIIYSGVIVFFQFALFMLLGLFLMVLMQNKGFSKPDEIMPVFIINYLPVGLKGLMLAGIFAAAMSTLSSSINSLSASTAIDILGITGKDYSDRKKLFLSRIIALTWTLVIIAISSLLSDNKSPLVELGLTIASITYGGMLGIFILGRFSKTFNETAALIGVLAGIVVIVRIMMPLPQGQDLNSMWFWVEFLISLDIKIFWPWFVPIGCVVSLLVGMFANLFLPKRESG
ncbi:MAG: sodium/solute symporter [bacterium]|nr:sodium/solute symporter [bacterium]